MKIVSIVGARPQFIKASLLSAELRKRHKEVIVHTGQHFDRNMSDVFFSQLRIPSPKYNLGISSMPRKKMIASMVKKLVPVLAREKPALVIVFGDTNSTLAGAIAAKKLQIPIAHAEAGLRSYDMKMPEEKNRRATDKLSDILLCPTHQAMHNLGKEGIGKGGKQRAFLSGDLMIELLHKNIANAGRSSILARLELKPKGYILATIHRASNTDSKKNLTQILSAFADSPIPVVIPIHPRTFKAILKFGLNNYLEGKNIRIIRPLPYFDTLALQKNAFKVITDSGGIQKEAFELGVPCITIRMNTEWAETLAKGWNRLVPSRKAAILKAINASRPSGKKPRAYSSRKASIAMVRQIEEYFK
ncbi:UDP-N-acetylglucosamine 2-epimerase (non-hydrolyzing) [Candidatus Woesearchaeota archaeon]|nr:UDP-N-acetylglucosamine 2-epimerase (non-hydrolyzing) [Candidatus Woesearchaeota archaeon]